MPEPIVSREDGIYPEHQVLLADSVGPAPLVIFETLQAALTARVSSKASIHRLT